MSCKKNRSDDTLYKVYKKDGSTEQIRHPRSCGCDPSKLAGESKWWGRKIKVDWDDVVSINEQD